jgi:acetyltransferase-like isoleucine patch superfamily enzyme
VWLSGDRIELGDGVAFSYGCYVNGYRGLVIGDGTILGKDAVTARAWAPQR